ncbi:hypothetical protein C7S18_19925 [Ahniella affigens]|uniref:Uncharacterized protein n=1 Tax=Ahniella affigens TaxID=2021234 RepID=A0A2P1PWT6_9GAMM|nr:hypothetical protein [Ahniella affigens]AVP99296.1 hypothetical protein C7S18_19925 [Ahniella affigens]
MNVKARTTLLISLCVAAIAAIAIALAFFRSDEGNQPQSDQKNQPQLPSQADSDPDSEALLESHQFEKAIVPSKSATPTRDAPVFDYAPLAESFESRLEQAMHDPLTACQLLSDVERCRVYRENAKYVGSTEKPRLTQYNRATSVEDIDRADFEMYGATFENTKRLCDGFKNLTDGRMSNVWRIVRDRVDSPIASYAAYLNTAIDPGHPEDLNLLEDRAQGGDLVAAFLLSGEVSSIRTLLQASEEGRAKMYFWRRVVAKVSKPSGAVLDFSVGDKTLKGSLTDSQLSQLNADADGVYVRMYESRSQPDPKHILRTRLDRASCKSRP